MQVIDTQSHASGSRTLPKGHRWVVVDVETSGLRAYAHRVLSVAALVLREDGSVEQEYSTLVDPGCDPGPVHVHRLTRERLAGAPRFEQIAGELAEVLAGGTIVAHNAAFDYGFLDAEFRRAGAEIPVKHRLCTLALSRRLELDVTDHKLSTLAAHWHVQQLLEHDAYDDARVLSEVFVRSALLAESLQLPLPVVDCLSRRPAYPDSVPRVPCEWKNPGRLSLDVGLVQGMKVVVTGQTVTPRVPLAGRMADAGLDVMNSVSRQTSVVVCNDPGVQTGKIRKAMAEGIPVITEQQLEEMLTRVLPGEPKMRPVVEVAAPAAEPVIEPPPQAAPVEPLVDAQSLPERMLTGQKPKLWQGRRVLLLGGTHLDAVLMRSRLVQLGARPSLNLTAAVTDVLMLEGGDSDRRMPRITARELPVLTKTDVSAAVEKGVVPPHMRIESRISAPALARGEVIDLPARKTSWTVNVAWRAETDDFVFCNNPTAEDGAIELSIDGSSEQSVRLDLAALPDECARIAIAAAIDGERTFGELGAVSVSVDGEDGTAATFVLDAGTTERTMVLTEIYRRAGTWRLRAVGQGYEENLVALAARFGVDVEADHKQLCPGTSGNDLDPAVQHGRPERCCASNVRPRWRPSTTCSDMTPLPC
ncbi:MULTISPECIES: exonuclease domain-containing protein [Rhodococcus]|uniref:exonuclease domain-containing protein n=1 Tax=Rhodococcus TaxID=1827 RepID=UPI001EF113A5|nr:MULTISPECIES: exonuclease domain-containing protein [Rhodococcus]